MSKLFWFFIGAFVLYFIFRIKIVHLNKCVKQSWIIYPWESDKNEQ